MIVFKVNELMQKNNMSRYQLGKITGWNQRRINAFFFNRIKLVTIEELERLCEIFNCNVSDILENKETKKNQTKSE